MPQERRLTSSRLGRLSQLGRLAGSVAGGAVAEGMRQLAIGQRPSVGDMLLTPGNAKRLGDRLSEMRGAAMKVGQLLSMDSGQILPPHIKNIAIRQIVNRTTELGLEDKLYLKIYDEFVRDGRFTITEEADADGVLVGEITHYILKPYGWGAMGETTQYKLRVLMNIYFIDKVNNVTLWEEPNFEGWHIYYVETLVDQGGVTEDDAREIVWDDLSRKIFKRVFT